jgi:hypothetical protein
MNRRPIIPFSVTGNPSGILKEHHYALVPAGWYQSMPRYLLTVKPAGMIY